MRPDVTKRIRDAWIVLAFIAILNLVVFAVIGDLITGVIVGAIYGGLALWTRQRGSYAPLGIAIVLLVLDALGTIATGAYNVSFIAVRAIFIVVLVRAFLALWNARGAGVRAF
jgi:hypothetical protein